MPVSSSRLVRQIMKQHGINMIYSDNTKLGNRIVKCYAPRGDDVATEALIEDIRIQLTGNGNFFDIRRRPCYPDDSIIVEVPID
jgi:hypothetical protein